MDAIGPALVTEFAPPQRQAPEALARQVASLGGLGGLGAVLDAVPHVMFVLNAERQILYGNREARAFAASLGRSAFEGLRFGELLGCRNAATAPSGCGTGAGCRACGAIHATLVATAGRAAVEECRVASEGGDAFDLRMQASPFRVGSDAYVLAVVDDVSDERRRAVLERVFFHDVLNTASGVCGIAGLIASDPASLPEFKDDLVASSTLLVDEIKSQRLLLLAETSELEVHVAPVEARALLEEVLALYRSHPVARDRVVDLVVADPGLALRTDATILRRVLGNLLKNALEAVAPGAHVGLGAEVVGDRVVFACTNPGVIPPDVQRQLFLRSFSTKGRGRGVGTYSIRLLTERYLGGTVAFTSTAGAGTRFTVTLPRAIADRSGGGAV